MPLPGSQSPPPGYSLKPLTAGPAPRLAVAVADGQVPAFAILQETPEAVVYAGALIDSEGRIVQWMGLWVQRVVASPFFQFGGGLRDNASIDARWHEVRRGFAESGDGRLLPTGTEHLPAVPVRWDGAGNPVTSPASVVATDDAELAAAGLPGYAAGTHRYLKISGPDGIAWQPLTPGAPIPAPAAAPEAPGPAPVFNPHGGHVLFRMAAPWQLSEYTGILSSGQLPPPGPRLSSVVMLSLRDIRHQPGFLLRSWRGDMPPLAELFHLKLALLHSIMSAAEAAVRSRRLPLLNLKTRSFGVDWAGERSGLALWSAEAVLDTPAASVRWLDGGSDDDPVFLLPEEPPSSIYRHPDVAAPRLLRGNVRLSQLRPAGPQKDQLETEGTLILTESLPGSGDVILIHCPLAEKPIQATITAIEPARREVVFRSGRWRPAPGIAASLASGGQAPAPMDCDCAIVPRLSTPADLYSLGIIALEILCTGSGQGLPMVVDEALRLAHRISQEELSQDIIADTLAAWHRRESDAGGWCDVLSPRHLAAPAPDAETAARMVPPVAWFSAIAWAIRMLTGACTKAWFRTPGEGSARAPHLAFEQPMRDLRALLNRTQSLVTLEWKANLDIRDRILEALEQR